MNLTAAQIKETYGQDPAWCACMFWAVRETGVLKQFEEETGLRFSLPRNAIERMIDDATGFQNEMCNRFVNWFNERIWGCGPFGEPFPEVAAASSLRGSEGK